jgi:hypothetical protein
MADPEQLSVCLWPKIATHIEHLSVSFGETDLVASIAGADAEAFPSSSSIDIPAKILHLI